MAVTIETIQNWINEYFQGISNGDFNDVSSIPEKYTFGHMMGLCVASDNIPNGREIVKLFHRISDEYGKMQLRRKFLSGDKLKIVFLVISAAEWAADKVYRALKEDDRFETFIVGTATLGTDLKPVVETYNLTREFFVEGGYDFVDGYKDGRVLRWDEIGGYPDICIHLTPWWSSLPEELNITSLPLRVINLYIPYGLYLADDPEKTYAISCVYNADFMNLMHKIYIDTKKNAEGFKKYQLLEGENVVYSGYTKMDYFYEKHSYTDADIAKIWKVPPGIKQDEDFKRVIIAPHHTIADEGVVHFSTFDKNYDFLYRFAKKYRNISFIFKPHPNVRNKAVEKGVFRDSEEYENYLKAWNDLPNAKVVDEATYLEIFDTSDAMILDSVSFLAEYLYVNKPALLLTREDQAFNELGEEVYKCLYKVDGGDFEGIEKYIQEVVISGNDFEKPTRENIFREYMDYLDYNGRLAYEFILDSINELVSVN